MRDFFRSKCFVLIALGAGLSMIGCSSLHRTRDDRDASIEPDSDLNDTNPDRDADGPPPLEDGSPDGDIVVDDGGNEGDADSGSPPHDIVSECHGPDVACVPMDCAESIAIECIGLFLVDEDGHTIEDGFAFTEGPVGDGETCYVIEHDKNGYYEISLEHIPEELRRLDFLHDGEIGFSIQISAPGRHRLFCRFDEMCSDHFNLCEPFTLVEAPTSGTEITSDAPLEEEVVVEGDDGRIIFPAGAELWPPLGSPSWIAFSRYPFEEHRPCFIEPDHRPLDLYVVTPVEIVIDGHDPLESRARATIDLPNRAGLAPGTEVELWSLGGVQSGFWDHRQGEWRHETRARVTHDGSRIVTAPGEGLHFITYIGVYSVED